MSNYNSQLQSNNTNLQAILNAINELPEADTGGAQVTPVISVNPSNGLITATAGSKSSTHQLAFQAAKTITPSTASQIAVSSGYYTGGNITVAAIPTQTKSVMPTSTAQNVTPDSGKFLSKVTVNGDSNLVASNIKSGVSIFGVNGTLEDGGGTVVDDVSKAIINGTVTSISDDSIKSIRPYAFTSCTNLTTAGFLAVTDIGNYAFASCSNLTTVSFPAVTRIGICAFSGCGNLTNVSFPAVTTISTDAFYGCDNLITVSFPTATKIGSQAFEHCSRLTTASFPAAAIIGIYAFQYCSRLTTASFPAVTAISGAAFYNCYNLTTVSFPAATTIGSKAFYGCFNLTTASFPAATIIGSWAFIDCLNLSNLYLTSSSVCTLSNSNAFESTPIGGYSTYAGTYGSIYVPASLLTAYQTATNWTYFSSRFVGLSDSDIEDDTGVGTNLLSFTYVDIWGDEHICYCSPGMTWGDFIESDYDDIGLSTDGTYIHEYDEYFTCDASGVKVTVNDVIENNAIYYSQE